jgi:hypothetical protein
MNIQAKECMRIGHHIKNLILIKEVILIPLSMRTIMYIYNYLILARIISNQIIIKKRNQKKINIIIIINTTIIGILGSIIIIIKNIIIREEIITIIEQV